MHIRPSSRNRLLSALLAFVFFSLPACMGTDSGRNPSYGTGSLTGDDDTGSLSGKVQLNSEEAAFVTLLNAYRAQNGLAPLKVSITLTQASQWMSTDMAQKGYFSHTDSEGRSSFERMTDFGYPDNGYAGENIAAGNATAQATFTQWKNSSGHNANMLGSSYRVLGVGRAQGTGSGGYGWYWTTDFGSTVDKTL